MLQFGIELFRGIIRSLFGLIVFSLISGVIGIAIIPQQPRIGTEQDKTEAN